MEKNFNPVRGTSEYLPSEAGLREDVKAIILDNYRKNGFNLIETPILENLDLLLGSDGGDNLKLMFKTIKRGEQLDLTKPNLEEKDLVSEGLRYDLTVPLVRMFCNNREKLPLPFKSIQMGYAFRAERPQRGRLRQFVQCDVDIIGDASANAEVEVLTTGLNTLEKLGFKNLNLKINDRRVLNSIILHFGFDEKDIMSICVSLDKLDKIEIKGVKDELVEKGFNVEKIYNLMDALADIKKCGVKALSKYGVEDSVVADVKAIINNVNKLTNPANLIEYEVSVIRGQGYYTGTVYEVYSSNMRGAIAGGGRFDEMVGRLTGNNLPAVGFSIGFEPITILLKENETKISKENKIALLYGESDDYLKVMQKKQELLSEYCVSTYKIPKNLRNLLDKLKFCGFNFYQTFGSDQLKPLI